MGTNKGIVNVYQIEKRETNNICLHLYDTCNFLENPYSENLGLNKENITITQKLYDSAFTDVKIVTSKYSEGSFFVVMNNLQYIYERNFLKREVFIKKIIKNYF